MKKLIAVSLFFAAILAASTFAGGAQVAPTAPVASAPGFSTSGILASMGEFTGLLVRSGDTQVQIQELIWGLDKNDRLYAAYLRVLTLDGREVEMDHRDSMNAVFSGLQETHGFYTQSAQTEVWVEELLFGRNEDGFLVTAAIKGLTLDGRAIRRTAGWAVSDDVEPVKMCACIWSISCATGSCSKPANCAGAVGGAGCNCGPQGNGRCATRSSCACPTSGYCPTPQTECDADPNNPGTCACQ